MTHKSPVKKILAWKNPGPLGGDPRWDLEMVRDDNTRERAIDIDDSLVQKLISVAMRAREAHEAKFDEAMRVLAREKR